MADYLEVPLQDWLATFDGRVLEVHTGRQVGSMRYHVLLMTGFHIDGNILTVNLQHQEIGAWPFLEQQRPFVMQLVDAVNAARPHP
jgi:hypothetical protein